jgi:hypothetical protein
VQTSKLDANAIKLEQDFVKLKKELKSLWNLKNMKIGKFKGSWDNYG